MGSSGILLESPEIPEGTLTVRVAKGSMTDTIVGAEVTILELAEKVKQMTGSASEIVFVPYEEAYEEGFEDMPRRVPDISKIHDATGYEPTVSLDRILERVIESQSTS